MGENQGAGQMAFTFMNDVQPTFAKRGSGDYEARKNRERLRQARMSAEGRDIGDIPDVADVERRERCRSSLRLFCEEYFGEKFAMEWSEFQLDTIKRIQAAAMHGGQFALAMPRGSGKTSLCETAAVWAACYGYSRFVVVVGATDGATREIFESIQMSFETNENIVADFPEICYPIQALEGITNRCNGQTWHGKRTYIEWGSAGKLVFASVGDSKVGGTVIQAASMTGRIRGMKHLTPSGNILRPDFVIVDDPQTRDSAKSLSQTKQRMDLINSDILGLAGPAKKITVVVPCTVIYPNDLADQLLDREKNPTWNGKRHVFLEGFPSALPLWQRYWEIRAAGLRADKGVDESNRFYVLNRKEMDAGCKATWPVRYKPDEVSSIMSAMNIYFSNRQMFYAEYQNQPEAADEGDGERLTVKMVYDHLNRRPKGEIPQSVTKLTMFIDVQKNLLYWVLMGFSDNFTGFVVDYGAFPDQPREIFTTNDAAPTYGDIYPGSGFEGALTNALNDFALPKVQNTYIREDGAEMQVSRCLIDSGWGDSADTIYNFIRESGAANVFMPSKGVGVTAMMTPMSEYIRKPGETISPYEWHIGPIKNKRHVKLLRYDANYWKNFFRNRFFTSRGDPGAFSINAVQVSDRLNLLAEHLTSEYSITEVARGRRVDLWKLTQNRENHWFDCVVGCMVAASEQGCRLIIDQGNARGKEVRRITPRLNGGGAWSFGVAKSYGIGKTY